MFLKKSICVCVAMFANAAMAQAVIATEHQWTDDIVGSHFFQVGVDAWRINTSAAEDTTENMKSLSRLQLANSYPVWSSFRDVSPWVRFDGGLRVGQDTLLTLKYRSDQSTGSRLDEASIDRAFHNFGAKLGVLDPKISWCRTYDIDSPWVRENNPFCSIQPLNFARGSAQARRCMPTSLRVITACKRLQASTDRCGSITRQMSRQHSHWHLTLQSLVT
jgi:hypothetical protein